MKIETKQLTGYTLIKIYAPKNKVVTEYIVRFLKRRLLEIELLFKNIKAVVEDKEKL